MKRWITVLLIFSWLAAANQPTAAVESRGSRACTTWQEHSLEAKNGYPLNAEIYQTWLMGYLSGLAAGSGMDFLVGTDNETLIGMADEYCALNPKANLAVTGTSIARELMQIKRIVNVPTLP